MVISFRLFGPIFGGVLPLVVEKELLHKSSIAGEMLKGKSLGKLPLEDSADMHIHRERLDMAEAVEANAIRDFVTHAREGFQAGPSLLIGAEGKEAEVEVAGGYRPGRRRDVLVPIAQAEPLQGGRVGECLGLREVPPLGPREIAPGGGDVMAVSVAAAKSLYRRFDPGDIVVLGNDKRDQGFKGRLPENLHTVGRRGGAGYVRLRLPDEVILEIDPPCGKSGAVEVVLPKRPGGLGGGVEGVMVGNRVLMDYDLSVEAVDRRAISARGDDVAPRERSGRPSETLAGDRDLV